MAQKLLEKETLSLPDIVDILGPRPFPMKQNILEYLQELREREVVKDEASEDGEGVTDAEDETKDNEEKEEEKNEEKPEETDEQKK